jgi:hypothetical protein
MAKTLSLSCVNMQFFAHSSAIDTVNIFSDSCTLVLDNGDIVSFLKRCKSFSF